MFKSFNTENTFYIQQIFLHNTVGINIKNNKESNNHKHNKKQGGD